MAETIDLQAGRINICVQLAIHFKHTYFKMTFEPVIGEPVRCLTYARIRNEDVETFELFRKLLGHPVDLFQVSEIESVPGDRSVRRHFLQLLVDLCFCLLPLLLVRRDDDYGRTGASQSESIVESNASGATRDYGNSSGQVRYLLGPEPFAEQGRWLGGVGQDGGHGRDDRWYNCR